jgi:hypothetical protein
MEGKMDGSDTLIHVGLTVTKMGQKYDVMGLFIGHKLFVLLFRQTTFPDLHRLFKINTHT